MLIWLSGFLLAHCGNG